MASHEVKRGVSTEYACMRIQTHKNVTIGVIKAQTTLLLSREKRQRKHIA